MNERQLIIIVGPTAVGKTTLSVDIATFFSAEIVSCDSRQFYKELEIGTAKPTPDEMKGIKHHFVNSHSITQNFSAGDYEREAVSLLNNLFKTTTKIIMTGGSGLFVKAITHGLDDLPAVSKELRSSLMNRLTNEGLDALKSELKELDEEVYSKIDVNNPQRVVRALEVYYATGKKLSDFQNGESIDRDFEIIKIGLDRSRDELYERINLRVDEMIANGLVGEVKQLVDYKGYNALNTVGYKEVFAFLNNEINHEKMVDLIKQNTRRYAKRQLTWFKNQDSFNWFHPDQKNEIINFIEPSSL